MAKTFSGAILSIGTTAAIDYTSDGSAQTSFEADTYQQIRGVSNIGELGAAANIVQFSAIDDDFSEKSKGVRNAGDPVVQVGRLPSDAGQVAMRAAERTKFYYNFKLELQDAASELYTNTVIYFRALVAGVPMQFGGNEDFVMESYQLGVYPRPLILESELIS